MVLLILDFMLKNKQFSEKDILSLQFQVLKKTKLFEKTKQVAKELNQEINENEEKETKEKLSNFEKKLLENTEEKVILNLFKLG